MRRPASRSPAPENPPHFFKIIHSHVIHEGRLRIPTKFIRKFLNGLSGVAKLSVPGNRTWVVKLKKEKDGVWFEEGLGEFIKYYSINAGHLLLFRYDGDSKFHVIIFDMTASEIGYPYGNATAGTASELRKNKVDEPKTYNRSLTLKCKKERVENAEKAVKPFEEKVIRSQSEERRNGKLEIIEKSDDKAVEASEDLDDAIFESSEDDAAVEASEDYDDDIDVETSDDDAIEMLDADTFHKNVSRKTNFDECEEQGREKPCSQRNEVDDTKYEKKSEGKQCSSQLQCRQFSIETRSNKTAEVASSRIYKQASTSYECNHLLKCKKETLESKGKEKQLSDEDSRRQLKNVRNEAKTMAREENKEAIFLGNFGDNPFCKPITSRNTAIGKCGEKSTEFQQLGILSRSVANGTKSSVGDGSQQYQVQKRTVSCSGNGNSKLNPHRQCSTEQVKDVGKANLIVGGSKRSRVTDEESEEIWYGPWRIDKEGVIHCGKSRFGTFNHKVKKEELEMDVQRSERVPSELAEWRKTNLVKFGASSTTSSGLPINGSLERPGLNSVSEHGLPRHSKTNSHLFHSSCRTHDVKPIAKVRNISSKLPSSSHSKFDRRSDELRKARIIEPDRSNQGYQRVVSPILLSNQTSRLDNLGIMKIKEEAEDHMVSPASTSGNASFHVTMRR